MQCTHDATGEPDSVKDILVQVNNERRKKCVEYHGQYDRAVDRSFDKSENKRPSSRTLTYNITINAVYLAGDRCYIPAGLATCSEQMRICPHALELRSEQPRRLSTHRRRGWLTEVYSHFAKLCSNLSVLDPNNAL